MLAQQSAKAEPGIRNPASGIQHPEPGIPHTETDRQAFHRLAKLTPADYDRVRQAEAKRLGIRKETLDAEVATIRAELERAAAINAPHSTLQALEPWPAPVDGHHGPAIAEVLDKVATRYALHLVLPPGAAHAMTLWTAHTHAFQAFVQTPRLNLYSPDPGCGKTTALDIIASMVPRPLRTENLTAPVLFRLVDQHHPTLLLDEVDAYLPQAEELRGLLNAGHKRGACAYRCEGDNNAVRAFKAFAPAALAGIGPLPGTLADRSIPIPLVRAKPGEIAARFDGHRTEVETALARQLARWAGDNFAALQDCDPPLPATAFNRLADNWRPLFAIAHLAGDDWPAHALAAFNALTTADHRTTDHGTIPSASIALLENIRQVFAESGATRLSSNQLLAALLARPDCTPDSPLRIPRSAHRSLARALRPFGISPRAKRIGSIRAKGYDLADFRHAFTQLLGETPDPAPAYDPVHHPAPPRSNRSK